MHSYTITVTRRADDQHVAFPFCFELTVPIPAAAMWDQWIATLLDYDKSWFWPTRYSQPTVQGGVVEKGGRMILAYKIPNPHDATRPDKEATYEFDILECDEERMYYQYRATGSHPFLQGGGSLRISAIDDETCSLTWKGEYRHAADDDGKIAQGDVFAHFLCTFFTATAQKVRKHTE